MTHVVWKYWEGGEDEGGMCEGKGSEWKAYMYSAKTSYFHITQLSSPVHCKDTHVNFSPWTTVLCLLAFEHVSKSLLHQFL